MATWSPYQKGQTQRKHKQRIRLKENDWKGLVAIMEKYLLSVMIRAKV
jgi:hypothetical protein